MKPNDDFWSIALLDDSHQSQNENNEDVQDEDDGDVNRLFNILPPKNNANMATKSENILTLRIRMNCNDGVLSDVSGIPWDESLLLAGYLYGTDEGRRLCSDACFAPCVTDMSEEMQERTSTDIGGGILELGSGLGIVGIAAAAAAVVDQDSSVSVGHRITKDSTVVKESINYETRVVLTDRNDKSILSNLQKNLDVNDLLIRRFHTSVKTISDMNDTMDPYRLNPCHISVEPCDWHDVSAHLQNDTSNTQNVPIGPFNLILGSALIFLPDHAAACADTLFYYLRPTVAAATALEAKQSQALILELPERLGFKTHFLPRCRELGLKVSCKQLDDELISRVEMGLKRSIRSARDYRLYCLQRIHNG